MRLLWQSAVLASLLTVPGWSTTLYSNGAINGTDGGDGIVGVEVTDSFVISSSSTVTAVSNIGLEVAHLNTPTTLNWVISTLADGGGTVLASGTNAALSNTFLFTNGSSFDVYSSSFSVSSVALSAGTYCLELSNAKVSNPGNGSSVDWDINGGPSTADSNGSSIASESFEVDGTINAPEPASAVLFSIGLAALVGLARLRNRRA